MTASSDQFLTNPNYYRSKVRHTLSAHDDSRNWRFQRNVNDPARNKGVFSLTRLQVIVIGGIAIAEVIAMIVIFYLRHLPYYLQVILDTAIMAAIVSPWLYFLSFKPLLKHTQKQTRTEHIAQARLRLMQYSISHSMDELLQAILDEVEALVEGQIGFFHFLDSNQKEMLLQAWSTNTLENMCHTEGKGSHYEVEKAGVWADCFWQRKPVIYNDYALLANRKGLPEGHAPIVRLLSMPIMRNDRVVAILGIGNKPYDFTSEDVELVSAIADFSWDIVENKRAEIAFLESEAKFHTLVDWTYDWEQWIDPQGNFIYSSPSCERITGWSAEDFMTDPELAIRIAHPADAEIFREHQRIVHDPSVGPGQIEYRLVARDGSERWIEHVCRPLFGEGNRYLGRRISSRDITERKRTEREIEERNQKERMLMQTIHTMQMDIARDLHDTIGQNIGYLRMKLDYLSEETLRAPDEMAAEIQNMSSAANETYDLMRGTLALLHSEDSTDLLELFKRFAAQVSVRSTFQIDFTNYGEPRTLSANQMRQLFYVFREALSNIEKYANASNVSVEITWDDDHLVFVVFDNGSGFEKSQLESSGHYGIKSMQERARQLNGTLHVYSAPGAGTNIVLRVPYEFGIRAHTVFDT